MIFFIERRYKKLLEHASALKYEFNANLEHEKPLRETVELFINDYAKKPWSLFLSFIPFTPEHTARKLASKYLDQLAFYVKCAPVTVKLLQANNESKTFKRQAESLENILKSKNTKIIDLKTQVKTLEEKLDAKPTKRIVPSHAVQSKDGEFKSLRFRMHFFRNKSNSFSPQFATYNIDIFNRRINNKL
jgi:hypothetical protein